MNDVVVGLLMKAETAQAQAALKAVQGDLARAGASSRDLGAAAGAGGRGLASLGSAASTAAGGLDEVSRAGQVAVVQTQALSRTQTLAAGSVANLTAQFNDIGQMLAAGQSPLLLAIQQGSQIGQVIGPMGAAGAVGALRQALLAMISPVNLLTMGAIAAGAALVGMLTGAAEEAATVEDSIAAATDSIDAFGAAADRAALSTAGMIGEFGTASPALRAVLEDMAAIARLDAYAKIDATADSVRNLVLQLSWWDERSAVSATQDFLGLASVGTQSRQTAFEFATLLEQLSDAEEPAVKLATALDLRDRFLGITGGIGSMTDAQEEFYNGLLATIRDLELLGAKVRDTEDGLAASTTHTDALRDAVQDEAAARARATQSAIDAARTDRDRAAAIIADLDREAAMRAAIAQYGADSAAVAALRVAQEREIHGAMVASMNVSGQMKADMMASWDAANGLVSVDLVGALAAAGGAAGTIAGNLAAAAQSAWSAAQGAAAAAMAGGWRAQNQSLGDDERGSQADAVASAQAFQGERALRVAMQRAAGYNMGIPAAAGGGSGGTSAIGATREDLADLIRELEQERAVLRELDPVQQEILRHREVLAVATAEERAQVEQLITTRLAEAEAQEQLQRQMAETRDLGRDVIGSIVSDLREGASAGDILANVLDKIADKLLDLGTNGLTDALFGTGEPGAGAGLFGDLLGGLFDWGGGGGAGSGRSAREFALGDVFDSPMYFAMGAGRLGVMAEAGAEAIMPLTHAYGSGVGALVGGEEVTLPLTRLASGKLGVDLGTPSPFALGGAFGDVPAATAPASWRQAVAARSSDAPAETRALDINVAIDLRGAQGDQTEAIQRAVQAGVEAGLRQYDRALPARVRKITADPRAR